MARKTKKQKNIQLSPALMTVLIIIVLALGILGIQVPDFLQEWLDLPVENTQTVPTSGKNPGPVENGQATFLAKELINENKGWVKYHALDRLERATGADALLKKDMINTGTTANASVRPPGFISGKEPYLHSRGHLIGRQLGGSGDDPRNLVTLYQNPVNTPYMTKYENEVRAALEAGDTIRYRVTPVYSGDTLMCKEVVLEAKSLTYEGTVDFNVTILNER